MRHFLNQVAGQSRRLADDSAGNIALTFPLVAPVLIGLMGLGVDRAGPCVQKRSTSLTESQLVQWTKNRER